MATFQYWMNVSMDLFIEHAPNEEGGGDWMSIGQPLHEEFNRRADALSVMVEGRRVYEAMERFWPAAAEDPSLPEHLREYGRIWTAKPKLLVSRTRREAGHSTRVIGDDALEQLGALREQEPGTIGVGGANLASQLLAAGLLDELLLFVHPTLLGSGRPLFDGLTSPVRWDLVEHDVIEGVTMSRYAIRRD